MGSQSDRIGDLVEGGRERAICPHASIKERPREDTATRRPGSLKPRRALSLEPGHAGTLILDLQPQKP